MTDSYSPAAPAEASSFAPPVASPETETRDAAELARDEATDLKEHATDAASGVLDTARDEASNVVDEATAQARDLVAEAREELRSQADAQQARVAAGLRSVSDEFGVMASGANPDSVATNLVQAAARRTGRAASWLDGRDVGSLFTEIRSFAAKRPGTFIAGAIIAGVIAGRLTRSIASNAQDDGQAGPRRSSGRTASNTGSEFTSARVPSSAATETSTLPPGGQTPAVGQTSTPVYSSIAEERGDAVVAEPTSDEFSSAFAEDPQVGDQSNG